VVGSGGQASISFTAIPATFTDLILKISARTLSAGSDNFDGLEMKFNSSTTGYTRRLLYAYNGSPGSTTSTDSRWSFGNSNTSTGSTFSNTEIYIPNYSATQNKSVSTESALENNSASVFSIFVGAGLSTNTAAITSITITPESATNFVQHSTAYLYGVSNA